MPRKRESCSKGRKNHYFGRNTGGGGGMGKAPGNKCVWCNRTKEEIYHTKRFNLSEKSIRRLKL